MYFGVNSNQEPERQTWLGRIDVNRSLTLDMECPHNPVERGDYVTLTARGAEPNTTVKWYYSLTGCGGQTNILGLGVTLDISYAVFLAQSTADSAGTAVKNFTVPGDFPVGPVWLQAAENENTSEVIETEVVE